MGKPSRDKGKRFELEVSHALDAAGLSYIREQDGRTQGADFLIERHVALEARRRKDISAVRLNAWAEELEQKIPAHLSPVLAFRADHQPARVTMLLADFIEILRAAS